MSITLYRATDETPYAGVGSCWTPSAAHAAAYVDNPGFGGAVVYRAEVEPAHVLDLSRLAGKVALREIASEIGADDAGEQAEEWWDAGLCEVFQLLENDARVSRHLAESYSWIVYRDDYPAGCITWMRLDDEATIVVEVA